MADGKTLCCESPTNLVGTKAKQCCHGIWHFQEADGSDLLDFTRKCKATAVVLDPELQTKEWEVLRGVCQFFDPYRSISISVTLPHMYYILRVRRNPCYGNLSRACRRVREASSST